MFIVHSDTVFKVTPGTTPNYNSGNPLLKLLNLMERAQLAVEREYYLMGQTQYLFPFASLSIYGPAGNDADILNLELQDNKNDFQKQNIKDFTTTDTFIIRGLMRLGEQICPFIRFSYRGGPDSKLSVAANHQLGEKIKLWLKINNAPTASIITVPYNPLSDRYEVELIGYPDADLRNKLDTKGIQSLDRQELQSRPDLIIGGMTSFNREGLNGQHLEDIDPGNVMHPILPLHLEVGWANFDENIWDAQDGANYHYEFNMILRGWNNYLETGISPNPHGGIGFLEYRNLMSNYGGKSKNNELGRSLNSWNFNAFGNKNHLGNFEPFFSVDYMDLHLLKSGCGIGIHRHRDNQEMFLMMEGRGFMVIGDWCKMDGRERCFEIRTLQPGHFAMLKGGNLHALMNATDEDISLFMCGGYD